GPAKNVRGRLERRRPPVGTSAACWCERRFRHVPLLRRTSPWPNRSVARLMLRIRQRWFCSDAATRFFAGNGAVNADLAHAALISHGFSPNRGENARVASKAYSEIPNRPPRRRAAI